MRLILYFICYALFIFEGIAQVTPSLNSPASSFSFIHELNQEENTYQNKLEVLDSKPPYKYLNVFSNDKNLIVEYHLENLTNKNTYYYHTLVLIKENQDISSRNFSLTIDSNSKYIYSDKGKLEWDNVFNQIGNQNTSVLFNLRVNAIEKITFKKRIPRFASYGGMMLLGQFFRQKTIDHRNSYINNWESGEAPEITSSIFDKAKRNNKLHIIFTNAGIVGMAVDYLLYALQRRKNKKTIRSIEQSFQGF